MNAKQYITIACFFIPQYCLATPTLTPSLDIAFTLPSQCYTQGLTYESNSLWLTCGQYRQSRIYQLDANNGQVLNQQTLPKHWFAEGNSLVGEDLIQLTWKNGLIARFNSADLALKHTQLHDGEGWGLAFNPEFGLIMSDGSDKISFLHVDDLSIQRQLSVTANGQPVMKLNELEWVNGSILANVWQTNQIAVIDSADGHIVQWVDLSQVIADEQKQGGEVLNGIAFNPTARRIYITGKNWRHIYTFQFEK